MNGQSGARKLARLLLADPLGVEGGWEQKVETGEFEGRGLLLRYEYASYGLGCRG